MPRHRRPLPVTTAAVARRARTRVAVALFGVSALAATVLAAVVEPAAPPAPDRAPEVTADRGPAVTSDRGPAVTSDRVPAVTSGLAQVSEK
ncbi:hypothetical protein ACIP93_09505 [Streptomyces sp. NPDC088745]|uniref:hypothetical protein n=1 Tax=Streptomyces sp. NPDC088745 TaxID=3365884 RepID=UPI00381077DE